MRLYRLSSYVIFREYGFCIPTKFVLGGQIGTESTLKVKSVNEAKETQRSLSIDAKIPIFNTSGDAGVKNARVKEEKNQAIHMLSSDIKYMKGGDENLVDKPKQWRKELPSQIDKWRVIETGDFIPIIDCLTAETQKKCLSLISTFYKSKESLSLEGMWFAINDNFPLLDALLEDIAAGRLVIGTDNSHCWDTVCKRNKPISACYLQQISGPGGKVNIKKRIKRLQGLRTLQVAREKSYFLSLPIINALFEDIAVGRLVIGTDNAHEWGTVCYKNHKPISACYLQKFAGPAGKRRIKTEESRVNRLNNLNVLESVKCEIIRCRDVLNKIYLKEEKYSVIWDAKINKVKK